METRKKIVAAMAAMSWLAFGVGAKADLQLTTPVGLNPGDQFRFVFLTDDPSDATSFNISDYDAYVNSEANGATYDGTTVTW
jgi:hypothetical protein